MSQPFIGQIQAFSFNFAPSGWAQCNGQIMPINQNQALFSLLGTTYGGDGVTTFALPNLQGRFPLGVASAFVLGATAGEANHTLLITEIPQHTHPMAACSATGTAGTPVGNFPAPAADGASLFGNPANTSLGTGSSPTGGGQPHPNMPPYLVMNFCIAVVGIFPSRN